MTFLRRFGFLALLLVFVASLTSCNKNPVIQIPGAPPARFYVANFVDKTVVVFNQPLGPTSTPSFTLTTPTFASAIAVDAAGNVYVPVGNSILVYTGPISSVSTPTTIGPVAGAVSFRGATVDAAGNLWVADSGAQVFEFTLPLSASPIRVLQCACFGFPFATSFDLGGHIFVADDFGFVNVLNIPTGTGTFVLSPVATITASGASGIAVDVHDRLFVADFSGSEINVFTPPFATGNTPAFAVSPPIVTSATIANCPGLGLPTPVPCTLSTPELMLFDRAGNLYVAYHSDTTTTPTGGVAVFPAPFSTASAALFIMQGSTSGFTDPVGVGFAP